MPSMVWPNIMTSERDKMAKATTIFMETNGEEEKGQAEKIMTRGHLGTTGISQSKTQLIGNFGYLHRKAALSVKPVTAISYSVINSF